MGKFMNVSGELRDRITIANNAFTRSYEVFCAKKLADSITRRYHEKKRQITESKQQLDQILHLPLINFVYHLEFEQKTGFAEWILLN